MPRASEKYSQFGNGPPPSHLCLHPPHGLSLPQPLESSNHRSRWASHLGPLLELFPLSFSPQTLSPSFSGYLPRLHSHCQGASWGQCLYLKSNVKSMWWANPSWCPSPDPTEAATSSWQWLDPRAVQQAQARFSGFRGMSLDLIHQPYGLCSFIFIHSAKCPGSQGLGPGFAHTLKKKKKGVLALAAHILKKGEKKKRTCCVTFWNTK